MLTNSWSDLSSPAPKTTASVRALLCQSRTQGDTTMRAVVPTSSNSQKVKQVTRPGIWRAARARRWLSHCAQVWPGLLPQPCTEALAISRHPLQLMHEGHMPAYGSRRVVCNMHEVTAVQNSADRACSAGCSLQPSHHPMRLDVGMIGEGKDSSVTPA